MSECGRWVPSAQGWVLSSWLLVGSRARCLPNPWRSAAWLGWAGQAKCPFSPLRVSWPRQGLCWRGRWAVTGLAGSWLPGRESLSLPLKASPLWARERWGPPSREQPRLPTPPPPNPLLSAPPHLILVHLLEGGFRLPASSRTDSPATLQPHLFCVNPAGWRLLSPILFPFSFLFFFFSPSFHSFLFFKSSPFGIFSSPRRGSGSVLSLPTGWVPAGLGSWVGCQWGWRDPPQAGRGPCPSAPLARIRVSVLEPPGIGTRACLGFLLSFLIT